MLLGYIMLTRYICVCSAVRRPSFFSKNTALILPRMTCFQDLNRYPRQLERDLELLGAEGLADLMFAPNSDEMYTRDHR